MTANLLKKALSLHQINLGYCPICEQRTLFIARHSWFRDHYVCIRCKSIPRFRALVDALESYFPEWRKLNIHESSPGGASSIKIAQECTQYIGSHYYPDVKPGSVKHGYRCENLESQTFENDSFDLVITQDVFEHVLNPGIAFREIARTLKSGGAHVFTVPWFYWQKTQIRAVERKDKKIEHILPPEYHGNPISPEGSLVVTDWGYDMLEYIYQQSGLFTTVVRIHDLNKGIVAKFIEVFISQKIRV